MSANRRRREWCRLVLSGFLAAFSFVFFSQMTTYGELRAAVIDDSGQVDDGGKITCNDDDNDPATDNDDANDVDSPDDDDDCTGGGGGSGGSGGMGGSNCPLPQNDQGHALVATAYSDLYDPTWGYQKGSGDQHALVACVVNTGEAWKSFDTSLNPSVLYASLGHSVFNMEVDCCKEPFISDLYRFLDGESFLTYFFGDTGTVSVEHLTDWTGNWMPTTLGSGITIEHLGVDVGCRVATDWQQPLEFRFKGLQAGSTDLLLGYDPDAVDECPQWNGTFGDTSLVEVRVYEWESTDTQGLLDNGNIPLVFYDPDEDGNNNYNHPYEFTLDITPPELGAPLGEYYIEILDASYLPSIGKIRVETSDGVTINHGQSLAAEETLTFHVFAEDWGDFATIRFDYNPYDPALQDFSSGNQNEYFSRKEFNFKTYQIESYQMPAVDIAFTADQGIPGFVEADQSMTLLYRHTVGGVLDGVGDASEVEWFIESGNGGIADGSPGGNQVITNTVGGSTSVISQIPPTTDEAQQIKGKVTKLELEGTVIETDLDLLFGEVTVDPGLGDNVTFTESASEYPADGTSVVDIQVDVFDQYGNVVADGEPVSVYSAKEGRFTHWEETDDPEWPEAMILETVNGQVSTQLESSIYIEDQNYDIAVAEGVAESSTINVRAVTATISSNVTQLDASLEEEALITATFVDDQGNNVADGTVVYAVLSDGFVLNLDGSFRSVTEPFSTQNGQVQFKVSSEGTSSRAGQTIAVGVMSGKAHDFINLSIVHTENSLYYRVLNKKRIWDGSESQDGFYEHFYFDDVSVLIPYYTGNDLEIVGAPGDVVTVSYELFKNLACYPFSTIAAGNIAEDECDNHDMQLFGGSLNTDEYTSSPASLSFAKTDYGEIADHADFSRLSYAYTVNVNPVDSADVQGTLIAKQNEYSLSINGDDEIEWTVHTDQGAQTLSTDFAIEADVWTAITVGVDQGKQFLRVNSQLLTQDLLGLRSDTTSPVLVAQNFNGLFDDLKLRHSDQVFGSGDFITFTGVDGSGQVVLDANGKALISAQATGNGSFLSGQDGQPFFIEITRPGSGPAPDDEDNKFKQGWNSFKNNTSGVWQGLWLKLSGGDSDDISPVEQPIAYDVAKGIEKEYAKTRGEFKELWDWYDPSEAAMSSGNYMAALWPGGEPPEHLDGILSTLETLTTFFPPLARFIRATRKINKMLKVIPGDSSEIFLRALQDWGRRYWSDLKKVFFFQKTASEFVSSFKKRIDFIEHIADKAVEFADDPDQFAKILNVISAQKGTALLHARMSEAFGREKYEVVLDALLGIAEDSNFAKAGKFTSEELAHAAGRTLGTLPNGMLSDMKIEDELELIGMIRGLGWLGARTDMGNYDYLRMAFTRPYFDSNAAQRLYFLEYAAKILEDNPGGFDGMKKLLQKFADGNGTAVGDNLMFSMRAMASTTADGDKFFKLADLEDKDLPFIFYSNLDNYLPIKNLNSIVGTPHCPDSSDVPIFIHNTVFGPSQTKILVEPEAKESFDALIDASDYNSDKKNAMKAMVEEIIELN